MGNHPRLLLVLVLLAGWVAGGASALAEEPPQKGIEVRVPPPPRAPGVRFEPGQPREMDRVREEEHYPERIGARHEPAFLAPLSVTVPTGPGTTVRAGLAGWTAPRVPRDDREATGGAAFGLTLKWGISLPTEEGVALAR